MPRGDRTGPGGMGPMSGRASGYCANYETPGFMNRFFGRGSGAGFGQNRQGGGRGGGFGWRNMFRSIGLRQGFGRQAGMPGRMRFGNNSAPQSNPDTEKQALKNQVEVLKTQLGLLQKRLDELDPQVSDK
jgi:hypothetical protein